MKLPEQWEKVTKFSRGKDFARELDRSDPLADYRQNFTIPKSSEGNEVIYFLGNSLGLQPSGAIEAVMEEMETWRTDAIGGHFKKQRPWSLYETNLIDKSAALVGALPSEVTVMNSLTVNLHLLMISFYRPTRDRNKVLMEEKAFPSDQYAVASQLQYHGVDPSDGIVKAKSRNGENFIQNEEIIDLLEAEGDSIALILMGGVNYYSGQFFDMEKITAVGHAKGCVVGFDLAHAAGNVELMLHDWNVDFAAWCNYKYLNGGPGSIASIFVHERNGNRPDLPRFAGWWGHNRGTRFEMPAQFDPLPGAEGWQISNPHVLSAASLLPSLDLFDRVGMATLRQKSFQMTGYLEFLLDELESDAFTIITPRDRERRGGQLSLKFDLDAEEICNKLAENGVICDYRKPGVIRVAPAPFYNSFLDIYTFVEILKRLL
ncbi:MAG: kynureninase [Candidatus Neomarinimicrobiota bacterium]|nr:kynureninase [Candidatus Neomarinimicrobiota bacterium]